MEGGGRLEATLPWTGLRGGPARWAECQQEKRRLTFFGFSKVVCNLGLHVVGFLPIRQLLCRDCGLGGSGEEGRLFYILNF